MAILSRIFTDSLTCKLTLAIIFRQGWNDNFITVDMNESKDSYEADLSFVSVDSEILPSRESNTSLTVEESSSLYPFGTHFSGDIEVYDYPVYKGRSSDDGSFHKYTTTLVPVSPYVYASPVWSSLKVTGFSFGVAVNFPVPTFEPVGLYNISSARSGSNIREVDRGITTVQRMTRLTWVNLSGDEFSFLMSYIVTAVRTETFTLDFDDTILRLAPWEQRTGEEAETIFNVKLSSNEISYSKKSGNLWSVGIEVMKWQE